MAICGHCKQEMCDRATVSCTANTHVRYYTRSKLPAVPYKAPPPTTEEEWIVEWRKCHQELARLRPDLSQEKEEEARARFRQEVGLRWGRCHDCGVADGGFHHPGCDA